MTSFVPVPDDPRIGGSPVAFDPIEPLRAHEYVADQLRRHITLGLFVAGDALPPERDLARQFGVGRGTIQAALRLLEAQRLIESRRGRGGGTFVIGPGRDEASQQRILLELRLGRDKVEDALCFRRVVEEGSVRLAAEHATEDDATALAAICAAMREATSDPQAHRLDTEFHLRVASASRSAMLRDAVERARLALNAAILAQPESSLWYERVNAEHEAITTAIAAHDIRRAIRAMSEHLEHTEKAVRALVSALR